MKKKILLIITIIILSGLSSGQSDDLITKSSLLLDLNMGADFEVIGDARSSIDYLTVKYYFFPENGYQQTVTSLNSDPSASVKTDYLEFIYPKPMLRQYLFEINSEIRTYHKIARIRERIDFPIKEIDSTLIPYIQKTDKIDINDDIIKQASKLAEGKDDLYSVVFALASWTKENINYSLTTITAEASQKASWVLDNRFGVCDELTNLFIAMARSLGIPTRFVSGISYTNSDLFDTNWGLHGWAEVYFPEYGWIPFDPTYGQYGYVDPGHIKLKDSLDSDKSSTRFEWKGKNVEIKSEPMHLDVTVLKEYDKIPNLIDMEVKPYFNEVSFDSFNIIQATLKNNQDYYIGLEIQLSKSNELKFHSPNKRYILLKPKEQKSIYWMLQIDDKLNKKYIYTFPIEVFNNLGYSQKTSFKSTNSALDYGYNQANNLLNNLIEEEKKIYSREFDLNCNAPLFGFVSESFNVTCYTLNKGNVYLKNLNVCIKQDCQKIDLGISQSKNLIFEESINTSGESEILISAKNSYVNKISPLIIVIEEKPRIEINNFKIPDNLDYENFMISFDIQKKSLSIPREVTVQFHFNGQETKWQFDKIDSDQIFNIDMDKTLINPNDNTYGIFIEYYDTKNEKYTLAKEGNVKTNELKGMDKVFIWLSKFSRDIELWLNKVFS